MEQLELWGVMRCRIDVSNKQYKVYRLKHIAKEMEVKGETKEQVVTSEWYGMVDLLLVQNQSGWSQRR